MLVFVMWYRQYCTVIGSVIIAHHQPKADCKCTRHQSAMAKFSSKKISRTHGPPTIKRRADPHLVTAAKR